MNRVLDKTFERLPTAILGLWEKHLRIGWQIVDCSCVFRQKMRSKHIDARKPDPLAERGHHSVAVFRCNFLQEQRVVYSLRVFFARPGRQEDVARLGDVNARLGDVNARLAELRSHMDQRFEDMKDMWRSELHRVEEVLDARLKHLEER